jgi:nucleoside-diphosphate-sugar epimerase
MQRLSSAGWHIRALVRPGSIRKQAEGIAAEWITGDLEDIDSLRRLVNGADAVVHCAGVVRGAGKTDFERVNVDGVARMVRSAAERHPMPRFLLVSSLAAREPALSHYAASKRQGEAVLASESGVMPWVILRPPAVYGPGDREIRPLFQWMVRGIAPVIGSDENRISLLYVADLAEAIFRLLDQGMPSRRTYELHDGHAGGYSWQDIIHAVRRLSGRSVIRVKIPGAVLNIAASLNLAAARVLGGAPMLTPGKVRELNHPDWVGDNTALNSDTGWIPKVMLAEGLQRTLWPGDPLLTRQPYKDNGVEPHGNR